MRGGRNKVCVCWVGVIIVVVTVVVVIMVVGRRRRHRSGYDREAFGHDMKTYKLQVIRVWRKGRKEENGKRKEKKNKYILLKR